MSAVAPSSLRTGYWKKVMWPQEWNQEPLNQELTMPTNRPPPVFLIKTDCILLTIVRAFHWIRPRINSFVVSQALKSQSRFGLGWKKARWSFVNYDAENELAFDFWCITHFQFSFSDLDLWYFDRHRFPLNQWVKGEVANS